MLYTAQYNYHGPDRLDITVKGAPDSPFAPTWDMVMGVKNVTMTEQQYTDMYYQLLVTRCTQDPKPFQGLAQETGPGLDITVVCFCPSGAFCHRHLLCAFMAHNFKTLI